MSGEDWRVEVELHDEEHGYSLGERLRALDLDGEARRRLGRRVIVTRDGSKLFLYARTQDEADEAARVVDDLVRDDRLTGEIRKTRWHPLEEVWEDAAVPVPHTEAEREHERERYEAHVEATGDYDWYVHVRAPDRATAEQLEHRLRDEDLPVERRWRFLTIGATEDQAGALAQKLEDEVPDARVEIEPSRDLPTPLFVLLRSRF